MRTWESQRTDRHGCDETLRSGSRSQRERKEVWGWEMKEIPRALLLKIPRCEVLKPYRAYSFNPFHIIECSYRLQAVLKQRCVTSGPID